MVDSLKPSTISLYINIFTVLRFFFLTFFCIFAHMIKRVYQIADVHIRNLQRMEEYGEQLEKLRDYIIEDSSKFKSDECRIVLCGDLSHSKTAITAELVSFLSTWIRQLQEICEVIVISGNHDQNVTNNNRMDTLSAIFTAAAYDNAVHLDGYLGYDSGIVVEDNITWALYSIFTDFKRPDIEQARKDYPNNLVVGLFHGSIVGATLSNGCVMDSGTDGDTFRGCDFVMAGDIHKRQVLKRGDCEIVYPGSLIQQNLGETITQHGICIWDIPNRTHEFVDFNSDYGLYDFEIKSPEDIDNDKEILKNY